jgi:hypothetical protein
VESDLAAVEARLQSILDPYRDRLVQVEVYGLPFLARPSARKHDWFAGVSPGNGFIRFFLLPIHHHPELVAGISPALRKRKRGASLFGFPSLSEMEAAELEQLVARAFTIAVDGDDP